MLIFPYLIILSLLYLTTFKVVVCIDTSDGNSSINSPTWTYHANDSSQCVCGVNLTAAVVCDPSSRQVKVCGCHMITFDPARNQTYAGYSFYRCVKHFSQTSIVSPNAHRVNFEMCDQFNRDGLFCGTCKENHYPLVYSYKLNCRVFGSRN